MKRNALYIFLALLLATALTALAQSPTTSNMGGSQTKDPYGATLDHPNPGSATMPNGQATTSTTQAPAPATDTTATPSTTSSSSTDTSSSMNATPSTDTSTTNSPNTTANRSLPRTASDLPLLATIGLLALGGALTVRSIAKRNV